MKRFLALLGGFLFSFTLCVAFLPPQSSEAQQEPISPETSENTETSEDTPTTNCGGENWTIDPCPLEIDGNTEKVTIKFFGLDEDVDWRTCSIRKGCDLARDKAKEIGAFENGVLTIVVCGANEGKLKEVGDEGCGDDDYFHEGRVYQMALFEDEEQEIKGPIASFFVNHYYPKIAVNNGASSNGILEGANSFLEVKVFGDLRRGGGNRNNYQIVVEGKDNYGNTYKQDECIEVKSTEGNSAFFSRNQDKEGETGRSLNKGKYVIKVNEQVNEGTLGKLKTLADKCNGGFTYWHINIEIDEVGNIIGTPPFCSPSETTGISIDNDVCIQDPNISDVGKYKDFIDSLFEGSEVPLPCADTPENVAGKGFCGMVDTAIGTIPTNFQGFVNRLFTIVLSVAGVSALGLIIYGGYTYMTSRGDTEKIKHGREIITAAIIGLLFIIFSFVILQVITGEILRIPGFNNPEYSPETGVDRVDDGTVPGSELPPELFQ